VRVWGASGGLGSMAVQLIATAGANAIGVISDDEKRDFVLQLGAKGVINRKSFRCWGEMPKVGSAEYGDWLKEVREFGKAIWAHTGKGINVDIVFEHPGEQTFPVSVFVVRRGGMVVICAGTTGFNADIDLRYFWTRQKRFQGSHFANDDEARAANDLVAAGKVDPCLSRVFHFDEVAVPHQLLYENRHPNGNMAILVGATSPGLK
jgi:crotonyl-CoA carboxylase/reductase